ncbi:MAG TPA: S41 family peptidase [Chthoniobacteraceae bacterium]|jgi:carboxyl-terminal processing protease
MKKRLHKALVLILTTFCTLVGVHVYRAVAAPDREQDEGYASIATLARAIQLIRQDYVDEKKVDYDSLTHAALKGMLSSLDPHSQFMDQKDFKGMEDDTNSRFGGLGVIVSERDGNLIVVNPMEDSPAMRAGVLPGDQIIKIDGVPTERLNLNEAIEKLRGEVGDKITLTILRPSTREIKDYPMVRENIKVASVKDAKFLPRDVAGDYKIGYARVTQFNTPTAAELAKKLDELEAQGMQAFVLDLRFNPGGLLDSAVDVAGLFLPPKTVVVSTEGREPSQSHQYPTSENGKPRPYYPVAVLINSGSASGAEIVAGALKDLNRAILVGETTFGKGSVQSVIQLQDGSAVRLTTAKYYTPSKQVIHEHGVTPTVRATFTPDQERLLLLSRREDLTTAAEKHEAAAFRDTQLERAADALRGVLIYSQKTAVAN